MKLIKYINTNKKSQLAKGNNNKSPHHLSRNYSVDDIYNLLERWGAWAAAESSGVEWQPVAAGFKGLVAHSKKTRIQCNDDEGILIDGCVARLGRSRPDEYELLIAHFILRISLRKIAKKRKYSEGTIRKELQVAMGFVEGCMQIMK